MPSAVDPAIIEALGLDPDKTTMKSHGGSGFSSTFQLSSLVDGKERRYFVKTGQGEDAEAMFRGEHASLNAIHDTLPTFCPQSHAHGPLQSSPNRFFLATDFINLNRRASNCTFIPLDNSTPSTNCGPSPNAATGSSSTSKKPQTLAQKLATLHTTPVPPPPGEDKPQFGFPVPTCCGSTVQPNDFSPSWADFFAERRICAIGREGVRTQGQDREMQDLVERVAGEVVPRLLGEETLKGVAPVVVHGDLWGGNHGRGIIEGYSGEEEGGKGGRVEDVVFDPSCVYGHSEYELGIMRMFGGYGKQFWDEYLGIVGKSEPEGEWEDRVSLYELYHHLNHYALFGSGYRGSAVSIMKSLIKKFGKK